MIPEKIKHYLPIHIWNLEEIKGERIVTRPYVNLNKWNKAYALPHSLKKPCSKMIKHW